MSIFIDASALIAIIAGENDADALADALEDGGPPLCSPVSVWQAVAGLCRSHDLSIAEARQRVHLFLESAGVRLVAIGEREQEIAIDAYARFGKGRHPAALNMSDCFAYACAQAHRATLLFKGSDFSKTDLA